MMLLDIHMFERTSHIAVVDGEFICIHVQSVVRTWDVRCQLKSIERGLHFGMPCGGTTES